MPAISEVNHLIRKELSQHWFQKHGISGQPLDEVVSPAALAATHRSYKIGNITINVFDSASALNQNVAQQLIREFGQAGLVILPADSTHGDETGKAPGDIYRLVNEYFDKNQPHSFLRITHMDEISTAFKHRLKGSSVVPETFSGKIKLWLKNLLDKMPSRFHSIDPIELSHYRMFVEWQGGPRVIVGGVGAEVPPHIAYIGEEQGPDHKPVINNEPKLIKLRPQEAERRGVTHAATMGMSFFNLSNLKRVIITAKEDKKAVPIWYALREGLFGDAPSGKSGFGQLIKDFANGGKKAELILNFDKDAFDQVTLDAEIMRKLRSGTV